MSEGKVFEKLVVVFLLTGVNYCLSEVWRS
jgi:hypothetical protein